MSLFFISSFIFIFYFVWPFSDCLLSFILGSVSSLSSLSPGVLVKLLLKFLSNILTILTAVCFYFFAFFVYSYFLSYLHFYSYFLVFIFLLCFYFCYFTFLTILSSGIFIKLSVRIFLCFSTFSILLDRFLDCLLSLFYPITSFRVSFFCFL